MKSIVNDDQSILQSLLLRLEMKEFCKTVSIDKSIVCIIAFISLKGNV